MKPKLAFLTVTLTATAAAASIAVAVFAADKAPSEKPAAAPASVSSAMPRSDAVDAYVRALRDDLSKGKVKIINDVMRLGAAESATFWPIYQDYEEELFELGDKRVELVRGFADAQRAGRLSPDQATTIADGFFDFEQQRLTLLKKYHGVIAKDLSPVRAAQFTQIEHRVGTVVDLMIAAEVPLIRADDQAIPAAAAEGRRAAE